MRSHPTELTAEEIRGLVGEAPAMLEIGSHEGTDTAKFLAAMPGARLYCFEPDPRPRDRFERTIGDDARVTLYDTAVADMDGYKPFYASTGKAGHMDDWDFSGSLRPPTRHLKQSPDIRFKPPQNVRCVRLDTWHRLNPTIGRIDFQWVDCQGAQRDIITGGKLTLAVTRYVYIEAHHKPLYEGEPTQAELVDLLPGFEPLAVYALDNILFRNRHDL